MEGGQEAYAGNLSANCRGTFRRDFGLRDQLQRASVSIMANIAEGFA
jgi:four helix bundle protein